MRKRLGEVPENDLVGRKIVRVVTTKEGGSTVLLDDGSVIGMTTEGPSYIPVAPWLVGKETYLALKPSEQSYSGFDLATEVRVTVGTREVVPTGRAFERTDLYVPPEQEFTLEMMSYILHNEPGLVPRYNHELMLVEFWKLVTEK